MVKILKTSIAKSIKIIIYSDNGPEKNHGDHAYSLIKIGLFKNN